LAGSKKQGGVKMTEKRNYSERLCVLKINIYMSDLGDQYAWTPQKAVGKNKNLFVKDRG
jgi:hypothetical protein